MIEFARNFGFGRGFFGDLVSRFERIMPWAGRSSAWGDAMAKPRDDRQQDLLRPALEDIIDLGHPLVRAPYEFGWKVSIATPATKPKGGQFVLYAKALYGNPVDAHTLGPVVTKLETLTGVRPAASMSIRATVATTV
jgi:hypothetical protein